MTEQHIDEIVDSYKKCMEEVRSAIPQDILGKGCLLTSEDYRTISTTIWMETKKQERDERKPQSNYKRGNNYPPRESGNGNYGGSASEAQQKFIATLITNIGKEADKVVAQFLDTNGLKSCEDLDKSQASSLITILQPLSPKKPRQGSPLPRK